MGIKGNQRFSKVFKGHKKTDSKYNLSIEDFVFSPRFAGSSPTRLSRTQFDEISPSTAKR
jgi:hypothetical protein